MRDDDKNAQPVGTATATGNDDEDNTGQTLDDGSAADALDDPNTVGNETGPGAGGD